MRSMDVTQPTIPARRAVVSRRLRHVASIALLVLALNFTIGCETQKPSEVATVPKPKTTTEIGEFDPNAGLEKVSNEVKVSNPFTAALEAYQPLKQQIAGLGVDYAVKLFQASEGRFPKDHEEFMQRIIADNQMRLPSLPDGLSYQYDVENHTLVVVREDTGAAVE